MNSETILNGRPMNGQAISDHVGTLVCRQDLNVMTLLHWSLVSSGRCHRLRFVRSYNSRMRNAQYAQLPKNPIDVHQGNRSKAFCQSGLAIRLHNPINNKLNWLGAEMTATSLSLLSVLTPANFDQHCTMVRHAQPKFTFS